MKIFITGATGFIGRNLVEYYKGYDVIEYRRSNPLFDCLLMADPDVIINCAAEIYNQDLMWDANINIPAVCIDYLKGTKNKKMIQTNDIGEHFTPYKWNLDGDMLESIGHDNWDKGTVPYVIVVQVPMSIINIWQTIVQNLAFPNEHEINLDNNGRGAKIIETYKLKL